MQKRIELNEEFKRALHLMENTNHHIFITGKAGTGKSTLLEYFRSITKKNIAVLAPTGVAALNVHGETIHSFFGFKPNVTLDKIRRLPRKAALLYKNLDAIVIDEISMVRADLMDCIDYFLRLNGPDESKPFGGIQMIFIGDLYQLPPVVRGKERKLFRDVYKSEYFFDSFAFKSIDLEFVELKKVYRQKDDKFIEILNQVRNNTVSDESIKILNSRVNADFKNVEDWEYVVYLTTTNAMAERINRENLELLKGKTYSFKAEISGQFDEKLYPTDYELVIKKGAQVMMLNNDASGRWVNGTVGRVVGVSRKTVDGYRIIRVKFRDGRVEEVLPFTWEIFHYYYNEELGTIETETVGTFTQYPMKLAWAITIHKSQGKTFDRVIIDIGKGTFAHGQLYVALSRCTSLEGIILKKPISRKHIFMDWRIVKFLTEMKYREAQRKNPLEDKIEIIKKAIETGQPLEIVYLKPNDEESRRVVHPLELGEFKYRGRTFLGLKAFCTMRNEKRTFRVDRILSLKVLD